MKHISEYSDKEFMALVKELSQKETYLEKVKFFYDKNGRYSGQTRTIKGKEYTFSIKTKNKEDQLSWWEYFVEQRGKAYCKVWMDRDASGIDKADDRTRTIDVLLNDIQNIVMGNNDFKWGYRYGIKKTGLDSLNFDGINIESVMGGVGIGLGLYYAELELNRLKEDSKEEELILNIKTDFSEGYRLVLMEELGIIEYLAKRCEIPFNQPGKLTRVLGELMGIDVSPPRSRSFVASVKHLLNGNVEGKGPSNPTSRREVEAFLTRLNIPLNPKVKNK